MLLTHIKMNDIKVSVIIPTYRPGDYLYECLGSLCRQTLGSDSFEVIIVLNGCNEPYSEEIKEYVADKMQGFRVRFMQTDRPGVSNARNMALDAACGEYVAFIDDDDWVSPGYLADLLAEAAKGADVVEANVADYDETDGTCHDDYLTRAFHRNAARERVTLVSARSFMSSSCCKIIRREVIGNRRFDTRFRQGEDALFMATVSNRVKTIALATADTLYYRRLRAGSASRRVVARKEYVLNQLLLMRTYIGLYLSDVAHYSLPFFATRIAALSRNIVRAFR